MFKSKNRLIVSRSNGMTGKNYNERRSVVVAVRVGSQSKVHGATDFLFHPFIDRSIIATSECYPRRTSQSNWSDFYWLPIWERKRRIIRSLFIERFFKLKPLLRVNKAHFIRIIAPYSVRRYGTFPVCEYIMKLVKRDGIFLKPIIRSLVLWL